MTTDVPRRLLARLDELGRVLADRGDALALLGLGSVGADLDRLDDHSDLDFFVVVDDDAKPRYLADIDWLEALGPIAFEFENTVGRPQGAVRGRRVCGIRGVHARRARRRRLRRRPDRVATRRRTRRTGGTATPALARDRREPIEWYVGEALTNLYVGLHRDLRGERLSGMRLIQVHAVDRLIGLLDLLERRRRAQGSFAVERAVERRLDASALPLHALARATATTAKPRSRCSACWRDCGRGRPDGPGDPRPRRLTTARSDLHRDLVDLGGRDAVARVDPLDRVGVGAVEMQNTYPLTGSAQAWSKLTSSSPWIARSPSWAVFSARA